MQRPADIGRAPGDLVATNFGVPAGGVHRKDLRLVILARDLGETEHGERRLQVFGIVRVNDACAHALLQ
jgi:hypothetical protein